MLRKFFLYIQNSNIFKIALASLGLKILAAGIAFLNGVLLARMLGPSELGLYTLAMAGITFSATVVALGLPPLVTRQIAAYMAREQWAFLRGIILTGHRWTAISSALLLTLLGALVFGTNALPGLPNPMLLAGLVIIPVMAFNQLRAAILRGLHRVVLADIPDLFLRPVVLLFSLAGWYFLVKRADSTVAICLQLVATACAFVFGALILYTKMPQNVTRVIAKWERRLWAREVQPFFWVTIIALLEGQVAVYLLGYLAGSRPVGIFQAASQFVVPVSMGLVAVSLPLQPKLVAAWTAGKKREAQSLVAEASKLGAFIGIAGAVILIPFAGAATYLYGHQYQGAVDVLRILSVGQAINALAGPCGLVLSATGHQKKALFGVVAALIVNGLSNVVLVPLYAANGAAIAVTLSLLTWNALMVYWSCRLTNLKTSILQWSWPRVNA